MTDLFTSSPQTEKGRIPLSFASDQGALEEAFKMIGLLTPGRVRVAWIANTKDLEVLAVSSALLDSRRSELEVYEGAGLFDLPYDASGNLPKLRDLLQKRGIPQGHARQDPSESDCRDGRLLNDAERGNCSQLTSIHTRPRLNRKLWIRSGKNFPVVVLTVVRQIIPRIGATR